MTDVRAMGVTPLPRSLGVLGVLFLTLSVTTPASSVFVIIPGMLQEAGSGALWAMLIAGLVCIATAFVYAELSSAWPVAGGEYVMVARTIGPGAGFAMLGVNLVNNLLFPPVAGLGVAAVLTPIFPGLPAVPVAVAVVALSTLIGLFNIRVNALVTGIFLAIELLALIVVVALGLADVIRPLPELLFNPVMPTAQGLAPATPASIGIATTIAIFALNGYGAAVYFGEEMHEAPRQIAKAVLAALVLTLLCEAVPLAALLIAAPDLAAVFAGDDPFGTFVAASGGDTLAGWVAVGVAIAIVNAAIACLLASARFFYSTGRDRCWGNPIDAWMCAVHRRHASPWLSTLIAGGIGVAACFAPLKLLLVLSGAGLVAIYGGIAAAAIVGRRTGATAHAPYRMPLFPLAPLITFAALVYVVWTSWLDPEEGRPSLIVTGLQILFWLLYYRFVVRRRGPWEVRDPATG